MTNQSLSTRNNILGKLSTASMPMERRRSKVVRQPVWGNAAGLKQNLIQNGAQTKQINDLKQVEEDLNQYCTAQAHQVSISVASGISQSWAIHNGNLLTGTATGDTELAISEAYCALMDTGTLVLLSSPQQPTLLSFLSTIHVILVSSQRIVQTKQDFCALLAQEVPTQPRAINLISGPSRTADIEQTLQIGAHGPKALWVYIL